MSEFITLKPQPGPQTKFLANSADIVIYGGSAGGGKTFGILLDFLRHINNSKAGAVFFRRTTKQVSTEGGAWDESEKVFPLVNAKPIASRYIWKFPSGAKFTFAHLEHESDVLAYQGSQIPVIYFDELTHFTEKQFWYLQSRNRTDSGIRPYIRASCNPDPDSFVCQLILWWLYPEGHELAGTPIPSRSGAIRWFYRHEDKMIWGDSKEQLMMDYGHLFINPETDEVIPPVSFTFIPSKLSDNKILMRKDPLYLAKLNAMGKVDRARLLGGNWFIKEAAGLMFKRGYFEEVDAHPELVKIVRCWDRAATAWKKGEEAKLSLTKDKKKTKPDATAGVLLGRCKGGFYYVLDVEHDHLSAFDVERLIKNTASRDGIGVKVKGFQDPGSAGKNEAENFIKMLAGYDVTVEKIAVDKVTAAKPVSAQAEAGNIRVLSSCRNKELFYNELEAFPDGSNDDIVDAFSGAFNEIALARVGEFTDNMAQSSKASVSNFNLTSGTPW